MLLYIAPFSTTLVLHLGVEKWHRASESASDMPSWEPYEAGQTDMIM
jgi:hypothetical protein